jgi:lipid-A-disaccharide synthase-like uncharacterized protein
VSELLLAYSWLSFMSLPADPGDRMWLAVGLCGNACFFTRFLVQWAYSERAKESKIPVVFWWQSIVGSLILLAYFVHRQDPVGVLGYVVNVVPYTRNLVLVYRKRRTDAEAARAKLPVLPREES